MNSKNLTSAERRHLAAVKELPCSVCDAPPISDAHHIEQGSHFTVVALCEDCHQGSANGWHGRRVLWKIKKMDELDALNITLGRLMKEYA